MIVVKIELHSARTGKVTELGRIGITNDGSGTPARGNYNVYKFGKRRLAPLAFARVENHARKSNTIFRLLLKALLALKV